MSSKKGFGLLIPKKSQASRPTASNIFNSDSDDEPPLKNPKLAKIPQSKPISAIKVEDPSIYEYDSVYDDMKAQTSSAKQPAKDSKPSRYIENLLIAADKRKKEMERRIEKKVQLEREKEGDKYKDKEAFVTSAYRKKMQEREEEEERQRREDALNDMMDVTKQKDLSGFYRHFLKQSVGEENIPVFGEDKTVVKEEVVSEPEADAEPSHVNPHDLDKDTDMSSSSDSEDEGDIKLKQSKMSSRERHSLVGQSSTSKHQGEIKEKSIFSGRKRKTLSVNIRKPTDCAASESDTSHSSEDERSPALPKKSPNPCPDKTASKKVQGNEDSDDSQSSDSSIDESSRKSQKYAESLENNGKASEALSDKESEPKKPKKNIWEKRTVGVAFAEAQARYFQRMAARNT